MMNIVKSNILLIIAGVIVGYFLMLILPGRSGVGFETGNYESFIQMVGEDYALVTVSTCSYCKQARAFLDEGEIKYVELSLDQNPNEKKLILENFDVSLVPILINKNKMAIGFNERKWRAFLNSVGDYKPNS